MNCDIIEKKTPRQIESEWRVKRFSETKNYPAEFLELFNVEDLWHIVKNYDIHKFEYIRKDFVYKVILHSDEFQLEDKVIRNIKDVDITHHYPTRTLRLGRLLSLRCRDGLNRLFLV